MIQNKKQFGKLIKKLNFLHFSKKIKHKNKKNLDARMAWRISHGGID